MNRSWLLLVLLGNTALLGTASVAAEKQESVITRQEVRRQVYLYNGWTADTFGSRSPMAPARALESQNS